MALHLSDSQDVVSEPNRVLERCGRRSDFVITHAGAGYSRRTGSYVGQKLANHSQHKKLIYLIRDPRDVIVSHYFQLE